MARVFVLGSLGSGFFVNTPSRYSYLGYGFRDWGLGFRVVFGAVGTGGVGRSWSLAFGEIHRGSASLEVHSLGSCRKN